MPQDKVAIIIPARNEADAIGEVVRSVITQVERVIVADNGSTDGTGDIARAAGAQVVQVPQPGYGRACLAGIALADDTDIIVFMDGDRADDPAGLLALLQPIQTRQADFVVGSRLIGDVERGALTVPQRFGNRLACFLMRLFWKGRFTDLGPFRAIRTDTLNALGLTAKTYGWTVEMQVRVLKASIPYTEVPVRYRQRVGVSKISGTVKGVILAGAYILGVIAREALLTPRSKGPLPTGRRE